MYDACTSGHDIREGDIFMSQGWGLQRYTVLNLLDGLVITRIESENPKRCIMTVYKRSDFEGVINWNSLIRRPG